MSSATHRSAYQCMRARKHIRGTYRTTPASESAQYSQPACEPTCVRCQQGFSNRRQLPAASKLQNLQMWTLLDCNADISIIHQSVTQVQLMDTCKQKTQFRRLRSSSVASFPSYGGERVSVPLNSLHTPCKVRLTSETSSLCLG